MPARRIPEGEKAISAELREIYGGCMTLTDVMNEIGVKHAKPAKEFVEGIPATRINRRLRWRTADVARRLYECREETAV